MFLCDLVCFSCLFVSWGTARRCWLPLPQAPPSGPSLRSLPQVPPSGPSLRPLPCFLSPCSSCCSWFYYQDVLVQSWRSRFAHCDDSPLPFYPSAQIKTMKLKFSKLITVYVLFLLWEFIHPSRQYPGGWFPLISSLVLICKGKSDINLFDDVVFFLSANRMSYPRLYDSSQSAVHFSEVLLL